MLFIFTGVDGQLFTPSIPISWRTAISPLDVFPTTTLPVVDVSALLQEDIAHSNEKDRAFRYAFKHSVDFSLNESGRWKNLDNGDRIWRIGIKSSDALALNVTFSDFNLAKGASVFIYNEDRTEILGALTSENNKPGRSLGTTPISGDKIIIELYEPYRTRGFNSLRIRSVAHVYRNYNDESKSFGASQACNLDVECLSGSNAKEISSSIVLISIDDGTHWTTGTMINNTEEDGRPLLLTSNKSLVGNPEAWVVYFNLLSADCAMSSVKNSPLGRSLSGAQVLAHNDEKHFTLLELFQLPPFEWGIHLAGWERGTNYIEEARSIHHPGGDAKKYSESNTVIQSNTEFFNVEWNQGITEQGSVGAPLLNPNSQVIGWLTDGTANCTEGGSDVFFKLSEAWYGDSKESRLVDWLDPGDTGKNEASRLFPENAYAESFASDDNLVLYPVPASDAIQLFYKGNGVILKLSLIDLSGRNIRQFSDIGQLNVSDLPRGSYIFKLESSTETIVRKIILD